MALKREYTIYFLAGLAALLFPCLSTSAEPAERWYQVEVIVFKSPQTDSTAPEEAYGLHPLPRKIVNLLPPAELPTETAAQTDTIEEEALQTDLLEMPYQRLPENQLSMNKLAAQLASKNYTILLHWAWRQPIARSRRKNPYIELEANNFQLPTTAATQESTESTPEALETQPAETPLNEDNPSSEKFTPNANQEKSLTEATPTPAEDPRMMETPAPTPEEALAEAKENDPDFWQLTGALRINKLFDNTFRVYSRLNLAQNKQVTDNTVLSVERQIEQQQRVRPKKINYFDHPEFGLLIKIQPYSPDKSEKQS